MSEAVAPEAWALETRTIGRRALVYDQLDSTNLLALTLTDDPGYHGLALLAREQTAGRGQYGRSWQAPPGSSVLMSVLLFPTPALRRPALLTAWAAVSVCEAVSALTGLEASIKWPNDVLVRGKKICGILIEQRTTSHAEFPLATVVGIGLNVTQPAALFEQAGLPFAASLLSASGIALAWEVVACELIRQLDRHYHDLVDGALASVEARWVHRLGLVGSAVLVEGFHEHYRGRLLAMTFAGIDLGIGAGEVLRLAPEAIKHIHVAP